MFTFTIQARKKLKYALAVAITSIFSIPTFATDYYVSTSGSDSNDGSQSRPWRTIAKASQTVPSGSHMIYVAAGTYDEQPMPLKPGVSLQGAGIDQTIIK
ncbi:DUF1565 domain-containing protein, partial [Xanthocytophaga agilis]